MEDNRRVEWLRRDGDRQLVEDLSKDPALLQPCHHGRACREPEPLECEIPGTAAGPSVLFQQAHPGSLRRGQGSSGKAPKARSNHGHIHHL